MSAYKVHSVENCMASHFVVCIDSNSKIIYINCKNMWSHKVSLPRRRSKGFVTRSRPTNVVSGEGTRDEPLRTSAGEANKKRTLWGAIGTYCIFYSAPFTYKNC